MKQKTLIRVAHTKIIWIVGYLFLHLDFSFLFQLFYYVLTTATATVTFDVFKKQ